MLTQLGSALAPGPWDALEPATLNAAIALIASIKPHTELEALLAVQIVATGFASLRFLQLGQRHLEDAYIDVYGAYATRLMRLQLELVQALDKHRRGHKQPASAGDPLRNRGAMQKGQPARRVAVPGLAALLMSGNLTFRVPSVRPPTSSRSIATTVRPSRFLRLPMA